MANRFDIAVQAAPATAKSTPQSLLNVGPAAPTPVVDRSQLNKFNIGPVKTPIVSTSKGQALTTALEYPGQILPAIGKTALGVAKFGKDIGQGILRSIGKTGLSVLQAVNEKTDKLNIDSALEIDPSKDFLGKILFGNEKLRPLAPEIADNELKIKNSPFAQRFGLDKHALPLAFVGSVIGTGLDLTPFGGEDDAVKQLVKTSDKLGILKILEKLKVAPEIAEKVAVHLAAITDEVEMKDALDIIKSTNSLKLVDQAEVALKDSATSVISYIDKNGKKIYTDVTPEELGILKDEVANIPSAKKGFSQIHLDAKTPQLLETGQAVTREEFLKGHPQAAGVFDNAATQAEEVTSKNLGKKAKMDWSQNFEDEYNDLHVQAKELEAKLAEATTDRDRGYIQGEINNLSQKQLNLEHDFVNKWRREIGLPEEDLRTEDIPTADEFVSGGREGLPFDQGAQKIPGDSFDPGLGYGETQGIRQSLQAGQETSSQSLGKVPGDFLSNLSQTEKKSFKPIIADSAKTVKDKVHIMDYLQTPELVLKKLGLGNEAELLNKADEAYKKELPQEINKISKWFNEVADLPDAKEQIFKYLDGQEGIELTPLEQKVADEIKVYLSQWADRLGLPEDKRIATYITHIFEKDFIQKEFDPDLAKLITDKIPGSVYDPFLQERLGASGYKQDVFAALDAYVKRGVRKANFDPALKALQEAAKGLDVESQKYIQKYASRINLRPTEIDNLADNFIKSVVGYRFGQRPVSTISRGVRSTIYRGTLGLNFGSALKNLTQGVNTYAELGEVNTVKGYFKMFTRMAANNLGELEERGILQNDLIEDKRIGVYKTLLEKLDKPLFYLFETAEKINRGSAYFGAKAKYLAEGKAEEEAAELAKKVVAKTQFKFGNVHSPVIMSSDLAKTFLQFQSFSVKQAEFLKNMIKNKEYAGLVRFTVGSFAMIYSIGKLFGMKPSDMIPSVRVGSSPFFNAIQTLSGIVSPDETKRKEAKGKLGQVISTIVPAGVQIRKTIQGIKAYNQGKDTTPTGRTRYKIPKGPGNFIRAGLFGKNNLTEAQDYFNSFNTGSSTKSGNKFNTGASSTKAKSSGNRFNQ